MKEEFKVKFEDLLKKIGNHQIVALATRDDQKVASRTMCVVILNGFFYFQTDRTSEKAKQINVHNDVAISFGNYEIMGICEPLGHPLADDNKEVYDFFSKCFPDASKKYAHLEVEELYKVIPSMIKEWKYEDEAEIKVYKILERKYESIKLGY